MSEKNVSGITKIAVEGFRVDSGGHPSVDYPCRCE